MVRSAPCLRGPAQIRGAVLRSYSVRTVEEIDYFLRGLRVWLFEAIERAPEFGMDYTLRYNADRDALLDARWRLMGLPVG